MKKPGGSFTFKHTVCHKYSNSTADTQGGYLLLYLLQNHSRSVTYVPVTYINLSCSSANKRLYDYSLTGQNKSRGRIWTYACPDSFGLRKEKVIALCPRRLPPCHIAAYFLIKNSSLASALSCPSKKSINCLFFFSLIVRAKSFNEYNLLQGNTPVSTISENPPGKTMQIS